MKGILANQLPALQKKWRSNFSFLQGVLGIKVKIMLDWDPKGKQGPMTPLPDVVTIHMPKEEEEFAHKPHVGKEAEM